MFNALSRSSNAHFIEVVLSHNHNSIKEAFVSDLTLASNKLFTYNFIHAHTLRNVTMENTPASSKGHRLTWECQLYITLHPDPESELKEMLNILEDVQPLGPIVAEKIREVSISSSVLLTTLHVLTLLLFIAPFSLMMCLSFLLCFKSAWQARNIPPMVCHNLSLSLCGGVG